MMGWDLALVWGATLLVVAVAGTAIGFGGGF